MARQPILTADEKVFGYELLFRDGIANEFRATDPDSASRRTLDTSLQIGLEALCDEHNATLPELKSFVLPGGTEAAARLHVARTIARRAELASLEADVNPLARVYLNRVSDVLFIFARAANALASRDEPLWRPGG